MGQPNGDYGDGIVLSNTSRNRIVGNTVQRNGPYSGISLVLKSQYNEIRNNVVTDNNMMQAGDAGAGRQDMGIRIEGPAANPASSSRRRTGRPSRTGRSRTSAPVSSSPAEGATPSATSPCKTTWDSPTATTATASC